MFGLDAQTLIIRLIVLMTAIPIHESAHAIVASKLGDNTAKNLGRITLNPIPHLDPFGSVMLLLTGFGYAKPVPVVSRNFKDVKKGMALTAIAGPISNLLLALFLMVLFKLALLFALPFMALNHSGSLITLLSMMISINIGLAVFNLLPIPPLDGSRLLTALLPYKLYYAIAQYEQYIMIGLFVLLFSGLLSTPINALATMLFHLLDFATGFLGQLW